MTASTRSKQNPQHYVSNAQLLEEIRLSKNSYSEFADPKFADFDAIANSLDDLADPEKIEEARRNRTLKDPACKGLRTVRRQEFMALIPVEDLVFRVMTWDHVPRRDPPRENPKSEAEEHVRVNFPPFQHFIVKDGEPFCVGKSHWEGGLQNGHFSAEHGRVTDQLGAYLLRMAAGVGMKHNFKGYNYDLEAEAVMHLMRVCLTFNEARGANPFAYLTQIIVNEFRKVLNQEKKHRAVRDEMLIEQGAAPSYTYTNSHEFDREMEKAQAQAGYTVSHDEKQQELLEAAAPAEFAYQHETAPSPKHPTYRGNLPAAVIRDIREGYDNLKRGELQQFLIDYGKKHNIKPTNVKAIAYRKSYRHVK